MKRFIAAALLGSLAVSSALAQPAGPGPKGPQGGKAAGAQRGKAPKPVPEVPLPASTGEQNAAAALALFGDYACEFNQTVKVSMNPKYEGYIDVQFGKKAWTMKPVLSSTGALRLEDVKGQTLMLQIAHKSMLMDVKVGQRLVDECQHEKQAEAKRAYQAQSNGGGAGLIQGDAQPQR
jgi:hypothetical protein